MNEEKNYIIEELPPGWNWKTLAEVCVINPLKSETRILGNIDVSFVPMADLQAKQKYFQSSQVKKLNDVYTGYTYFKERDVLLAKVTPCFENGKSGIAKNLVNGIGFGSSEYYVLRSAKDILPEYIYHTISHPAFLQEGAENMSGAVGLKRVTKGFLFNYKIPVPPIEEQKEIITKLDNVFERIDKAVQLVKENLEHIKHLLAATLNDVFESGAKEGWAITKFSEFAILKHGYQFRNYDFVEQGIPVVKIGQCKSNGTLDLDGCDYISNDREKEFEDVKIYKDDLLMALTGGTLGKVTWVDKDYGVIVQNYRVGNFYPIKGKSIKRFLMFVLMSDIFQKLVSGKVNVGAQPNIGKEHIENMLVPLPSIAVQQKLVKYFDKILVNQQQLQEQYGRMLKQLKSLKASLLDAAFRGELTQQATKAKIIQLPTET